MAKLSAPLLSLGASGQIGKALVAATWKGIAYFRQYVVPANPNTTAQKTQRNLMKAIVLAWRAYITHATSHEAWNVLSGTMAGALSGFNAFVKRAIVVAAADADASFADEGAETLGTFDIMFKNLDDGAEGDETGTFDAWAGDSINNMQLKSSSQLAGGALAVTHGVKGGELAYVKVTKSAVDRSGIYVFTSATP